MLKFFQGPLVLLPVLTFFKIYLFYLFAYLDSDTNRKNNIDIYNVFFMLYAPFFIPIRDFMAFTINRTGSCGLPSLYI